jgi:hypothetical protein
MSHENSRQRRKIEAEKHNKLRAEHLALQQDKLDNPEKYRRKRRAASGSSAPRLMPFIAAAMAISPNAFDSRLSRKSR